MKKIDTSTPKYPNTFTLVDNDIFVAHNKYKWRLTECGKVRYVCRWGKVNGEKCLIYLHREVLGTEKGMQTDHINMDTLDNRRRNLRKCTIAENGRNREHPTNNTSGYKGVNWNKASSKWESRICVNAHRIRLGLFFCVIKAAKAYDTAAREYFGDFAKTNF